MLEKLVDSSVSVDKSWSSVRNGIRDELAGAIPDSRRHFWRTTIQTGSPATAPLPFVLLVSSNLVQEKGLLELVNSQNDRRRTKCWEYPTVIARGVRFVSRVFQTRLLVTKSGLFRFFLG
jgi:hypothetical protein